MRYLLPLFALLGACAKDFADMAPFPCPRDGRCPEGLVCLPEVGCSPAQADAPCPSEGECDDSGYDLVCWQSFCEPPCGEQCTDGRTCVAGVCLADCTGGGPCPAPLECKTFDAAAAASVCMPTWIELPACDHVTIGRSCLACDASTFNVPCDEGGYCAANSTCVGGNQCTCNTGFHGEDCNGTPCSSSNPCQYPDWHCVPNVTSILCREESFDFAVTCYCADGSTLALACGNGSCEEACLAQL